MWLTVLGGYPEGRCEPGAGREQHNGLDVIRRGHPAGNLRGLVGIAVLDDGNDPLARCREPE